MDYFRQDASEVLRVWDNENDTVQESRCLAFRESLYPLTPLPITCKTILV